MPFLKVENLSLKLENKSILREISFTLDKGETLLIAGRNGSGKSMLLKALKGLEKSKGDICLDGEILTKTKDRMRSFSIVFQDTELQIVGTTLYRDVLFGLENLEMDNIEARANEALKEFGLYKIKDRNPDELSGGEKRKLSIASLMATEPKILLMDEPFANLDWPSSKTLIKAIERLKEKKATIIIVSHEADRILSLIDRTLILKNGEKVWEGASKDSLDELRKNDIYIPENSRFEDLKWL